MVKISFSSVFADKNFSPALQGIACSAVQISRNSRFKGNRMFGKWQNFPIFRSPDFKQNSLYNECINEIPGFTLAIINKEPDSVNEPLLSPMSHISLVRYFMELRAYGSVTGGKSRFLRDSFDKM